MRITDQYFWNFVFSLFFMALLVMAGIILHSDAARTPAALTLFDITIMALASFRLTRLFVYDLITKFVREQFWDATKTRGGVVLEKPKVGPRRTMADLLSCPWCFGMWAGATVTFFYLWTPLAYFPVLLLAVSALGTFFQLLANLVGHQAEKAKREVEG